MTSDTRTTVLAAANIQAQPTSELTQRQHVLLDLLNTGHTIPTCARRLGVGLRTAQRDLEILKATAGVRSRFQLGVEAYRRRWLAHPVAEAVADEQE